MTSIAGTMYKCSVFFVCYRSLEAGVKNEDNPEHDQKEQASRKSPVKITRDKKEEIHVRKDSHDSIRPCSQQHTSQVSSIVGGK